MVEGDFGELLHARLKQGGGDGVQQVEEVGRGSSNLTLLDAEILIHSDSGGEERHYCLLAVLENQGSGACHWRKYGSSPAIDFGCLQAPGYCQGAAHGLRN